MTATTIAKVLDLDKQQYKRYVPMVFAYLFYRINQRELKARIDDPELAARIISKIKSSGYILKNCKLFAYYHASGQPCRPIDFGITSRQDILMLRRLNLRHLDQTKYPAMTLEQLDSHVSSLHTNKTIKEYVGKFVSKKMNFLVKSYGHDRKDIEGHLMEEAVYSVYQKYPRYESYAHFVGVAMLTIRNSGNTFITANTNGKRQRLVKNSDGTFDSIQVTMDMVPEAATDSRDQIEFRDGLTSLVQLQQANKIKPRVQSFLMCMAGHHHEGLSEYLEMNNSDLAQQNYPRYERKVKQYFQVTDEQVTRMYSKLRARMEGAHQ